MVYLDGNLFPLIHDFSQLNRYPESQSRLTSIINKVSVNLAMGEIALNPIS